MGLLRKAMRMLDIKHRDLAMRMGVSPSYLSRLFHGVIDLKLDQLVRIVGALGLRPGEFFRIAYPDAPEPPSPAAVALRGLMPAVAGVAGAAGVTSTAAMPARPETPGLLAEPAPPAMPAGIPARQELPAYVTAQEVERQIEETVRRLFSELGRLNASDQHRSPR